MIHFERRLGVSWSTDKNRWGSWCYRLTQHPFTVEMRVAALAMLIPGLYLKRLNRVSYPFGDVMLAK